MQENKEAIIEECLNIIRSYEPQLEADMCHDIVRDRLAQAMEEIEAEIRNQFGMEE